MTIQDPEFGQLEWDDELAWWTGSIRLSAPETFRLYIHAQSETERDITPASRDAAARIRTSEAAIRRYAADKLLDTHNKNGWNDGNPLSAEEFIERLIPDGVSLYPDGYAEVGFADDDMFWGHFVEVSIQPDGTYQEAGIEG